MEGFQEVNAASAEHGKAANRGSGVRRWAGHVTWMAWRGLESIVERFEQGKESSTID